MKLHIPTKRIYETTIAGSFSSGKSTLINAFVGHSILPARQQPCTQKPVRILSNSHLKTPLLHYLSSIGKYNKENVDDFNLSGVLRRYEDNSEISDLIIETPFYSLRNMKKNFVITDTAGANNVASKAHFDSTMEVLAEKQEGLILYTIGINQIGTKDNSKILGHIVKQITEHPKIRIIFVLSQMDLINTSQEGVFDVIRSCREFLITVGLPNPHIIPVAAEAALLFRKAFHGEITEEDKNLFFKLLNKFYSGHVFDLSVAAKDGAYITVCGETIPETQLIVAMNNTGINLLEKEMENCLLTTLTAYRPVVRKSKK